MTFQNLGLTIGSQPLVLIAFATAISRQFYRIVITMTESIKATRAVIQIGSITVDGFMLPDGSYRMSLSQTAECVGLGVQNASDFLRSKAIKRLLGESYTPQIFEIESAEEQLRGQSRIRGLPLEIVSAYWLWQSHRSNKRALSLSMALITESLERRFDAAFGMTRTEKERNERLSGYIQQLERDLSKLGEAFAIDDQTRQERDYFERLLRENGIDPWALPQTER